MNIYATKNSLNNFYQRVARKNIFTYCHIARLSSTSLSLSLLQARSHTYTYKSFVFGGFEYKKSLFIQNVMRQYKLNFLDVFVA